MIRQGSLARQCVATCLNTAVAELQSCEKSVCQCSKTPERKVVGMDSQTPGFVRACRRRMGKDVLGAGAAGTSVLARLYDLTTTHVQP